MKKLGKKGFTLVELLAVIVILAIIVLIATRSIIKTMNSAKKKGYETDCNKLKQVMQEKLMLVDMGETTLNNCSGSVDCSAELEINAGNFTTIEVDKSSKTLTAETPDGACDWSPYTW